MHGPTRDSRGWLAKVGPGAAFGLLAGLSIAACATTHQLQLREVPGV